MTARETLPTGETKTARVRAMFDTIAPRYDLVNRVMTFGLDHHWRWQAVRCLALPGGSSVLDVACGTGALSQVARRAGHHVVGADMSDGMLRSAGGSSPAAQADAARLPFADATFDGVLCGYALRNFTDLGRSLREMGRVVRPGGRIAILEVATPPNPVVRAGHSIWFQRVVPLIGAALSDADAYRYLPSSVAYLPPDAQMRRMLRDAGYATVGRQLLHGGLSQILTGTRRSRGSSHHVPTLTPRELRGPDPASYVATSARLHGADAAFDPVAIAAAHGHLFAGRAQTVAGRGVAVVLELPRGLADAASDQVSEWLGAVEHTVEGATRRSSRPELIALGAFPFDREARATLVVPRRVWRRSSQGTAWCTTVGPRHATARSPVGPMDDADDPGADDPGADDPGADDPGADDPGRGPSRVISLAARPEGAEYARAVAAAVAQIRAGHLRKVVLARMVEARLSSPASPGAILRSLWGGNPALCAYSVPTPDGRLVGASPELLIARHGREIVSHAFAGTIARDPGADDAYASRLLDSAKDRDEHRLVVDEIARALTLCETLEVPESPSVVPLQSDARLGTLVHGILRCAPVAPPPVLSLLARLHPTPAVGGVERSDAIRCIAALETEPRGYWAGAAGWVDAIGDGEWVLAIRAALLSGTRALVHAGAGIVAGSDPQAELAETTLKLTPVLEAMCEGASTLLST